MLNKIWKIVIYSTPVALMIGLIPVVQNDYALAAIYSAFIIALLLFKHERHDLLALIFGFVAITLSELLFVSTGVETFVRNSLFGAIPLWLPFLWAYTFVTIKRSLNVLQK